MKAFRRGFALAGVLAGVIGAAEPVAAQRAPNTVSRDPNAPALMVLVFRGNQPNLGVQTADAIRERLGRDIPIRQLWNIPKDDIVKTLEASGYSTTEPLNANDAKALGTQLRADEYVEGRVSRGATGVVVNARLVLVRDPTLQQPFAAVTAGNPGGVASALSREIKAARAQLDDERNCYRLSREGKFPEAIAAARKGITDYPRATIARTCMLRAMVEAKASNDSVLALATEILAIDSTNRVALANAADIYKQQGAMDRAVEAWTNLLAADPTNTRLVEQVVRELGAAGEAPQAKPIIERAVAENPGDPGLVGLAWAVMRAVRDWDAAIKYGEELVQLDTARADTTYFVQLAAAYAADSQPQKSAEALSRGVAKFPTNASLQLARASALRTAGQTQQAIEALRAALAIDPKAGRARLLMGQLYMDMELPDSALAAIRQGAAAGDDSTALGQAALTFGNQLYRAANADTVAASKRAGFLQALPFLSLSDSLSANNTTKFLLGVTSFNLGLGYLQDVQREQRARNRAAACSAARTVTDYFNTAQINLPRGAETNAAAVTQLMGLIQQYGPYADQVTRQTCRA